MPVEEKAPGNGLLNSLLRYGTNVIQIIFRIFRLVCAGAWPGKELIVVVGIQGGVDEISFPYVESHVATGSGHRFYIELGGRNAFERLLDDKVQCGMRDYCVRRLIDRCFVAQQANKYRVRSPVSRADRGVIFQARASASLSGNKRDAGE